MGTRGEALRPLFGPLRPAARKPETVSSLSPWGGWEKFKREKVVEE